MCSSVTEMMTEVYGFLVFAGALAGVALLLWALLRVGDK